MIDTLGQQIAEKHWKMSNSGLAYSELWRAIETHPGVCGCAWWEDDPLSPTGRRPRAEIESCAPDTADESPAECAEDVQEIAAILDAGWVSRVSRWWSGCARRSARTSTAI